MVRGDTYHVQQYLVYMAQVHMAHDEYTRKLYKSPGVCDYDVTPISMTMISEMLYHTYVAPPHLPTNPPI